MFDVEQNPDINFVGFAFSNKIVSQKVLIPVETGNHVSNFLKRLDSYFRRNDRK